MNEEEIKAIETVKQYKKCFVFETVHEETGERLNDYSNAIDIVIKLIDKQQKEIKELSDKLTEKICKGVEEEILEEYRQTIISKDKEIEEFRGIKNGTTIIYKGKAKYVREDKINKYYISKDKIKETIKELEENNKRIEKQFKGGSQNLLQNYIENIAQIKILKQLLEE